MEEKLAGEQIIQTLRPEDVTTGHHVSDDVRRERVCSSITVCQWISCSVMGGNRQVTVGGNSSDWPGERGNTNPITPSTPIHLGSKRDSGYQTDCSPAGISAFTFDVPKQSTDKSTGGSDCLRRRHEAFHEKKFSMDLRGQGEVLLPMVDYLDEENDDAFLEGTLSSDHDSSVTNVATVPDTYRRRLLATVNVDELSDCSEQEDQICCCDSPSRNPKRMNGDADTSILSSDVSDLSSRCSHQFDDHRSREEPDHQRELDQGIRHGNFKLSRSHSSRVNVPDLTNQRVHLVARTIATQTTDIHSRPIDQILDCSSVWTPPSRGIQARRPRYYSEGEEREDNSLWSQTAPLPDLVPVDQGQRERSHSSLDNDLHMHYHGSERHVGRQLRHMSDEYDQLYGIRENNHPAIGMLAPLVAELNGLAAFFLTGFHRLFYHGFCPFVRHLHRKASQINSTAYAPSANSEAIADSDLGHSHEDVVNR